jgi:peptidoglycan/LPS O-acetylase OafA/YrhL
MLLIILCHTGDHVSRIFTPFGGIGVAMFLFLSGFGLNESYKKIGLKSFWPKRIGRVCFPYWLLAIVCFVIYNYSFKTFLLDISFIRAKYWFVSYLILNYICYYFSTLFFSRRRVILMLIFSIISLVLLPELEAEQSFSFVLGMLVSDKKEVIKSKNRYFVYWAVLFLIVGCLSLLLKQTSFVRGYQGYVLYNVVQLFIKMPIGLFFIIICRNMSIFRYNRFFIWIGLMSYELYLIHMLLLPILYNHWSIIWLILFWLSAILISYIYYRIDTIVYKNYLRLIKIR